jgi:hypothetical protein
MTALFSRPLPWGPRVHSIINMHSLVLQVFMARDRATIDKAMAITGRCLAHARAHGAADLVAYWENILRQQFELWQRWSPPEPPAKKKRGRPKGHRDIPDDEFFWRMYEGRIKWFKDHPGATTMTQGQLLAAMNIHPTDDTSRVRRWCRQLRINWEFFSKR